MQRLLLEIAGWFGSLNVDVYVDMVVVVVVTSRLTNKSYTTNDMTAHVLCRDCGNVVFSLLLPP